MPESNPIPDWDPHGDTAADEYLAVYDRMRRRCPVAHSEPQLWTLFRHADVLRVLLDHETFSNAVSPRLSVPNGMDPPLHAGYRRLIESFFTAAAVAAFEPTCRAIARQLATALTPGPAVRFIGNFAQPFAVQALCAFLGWPAALHKPLADWSARNRAAIAARDSDALGRLADEFTRFITAQLGVRRQAGTDAPEDVTTRLLRARVDGEPLRDEEIVSILRNWTAGEIGTMTAAIGIVAHFLAEHADIQQTVREERTKLPEAIDEILRLHGPLVANRRVATEDVEIAGQHIAAGERLSLLWISANRDEEAFQDAGEFRWGRSPAANLLYGAGVHVCPGAPLARLELHAALEALLDATETIELADETTVTDRYPGSGFVQLPLRIR